MKQHKRELTATYEAPNGVVYEILAWDILEPSTDGEDADGNRGWPCWECVDAGGESVPDADGTCDEDAIDGIIQSLFNRLENTPVSVPAI